MVSLSVGIVRLSASSSREREPNNHLSRGARWRETPCTISPLDVRSALLCVRRVIVRVDKNISHRLNHSTLSGARRRAPETEESALKVTCSRGPVFGPRTVSGETFSNDHQIEQTRWRSRDLDETRRTYFIASSCIKNRARYHHITLSVVGAF